MQAFHNDNNIKLKYVERVRLHAEADEIIKGTYWEKGKGCAVGCTVHSEDHRSYETELGIPQWLARLEDRIFEGLPNDKAMTFPVRFLDAANVGADLNKIKIPMLIFIVESAREKTKNERSLKAIDGVLAELKKDVLDLPKLREARVAADAAASAAYASAAAAAASVAADAAAAYAYAAAAAYAAASSAADAASASAAAASSSAYAAASASASAADASAADAARKNEYVKFSEKLLDLMRECK